MNFNRKYYAVSEKLNGGYAMASLLVAIAIMSIFMSMVVPAWTTWAKREKEAELIFRGEQFSRAIELYQRRFLGAYPTNLQMLVDQKFLRKIFRDPITGDEFRVLTQGSIRATPIRGQSSNEPENVTQIQSAGSLVQTTQTPTLDSQTRSLADEGVAAGDQEGGIIGVVSTSTDVSVVLYNGRGRYDEWLFVYPPQVTQSGTNIDSTDRPNTAVLQQSVTSPEIDRRN